MKILLTGGNGFIGRNILEQLGGKYNFFAPTHAELDFTDEAAVDALFASRSFDVVINCANIGGKRKEPYIADAVEKNLRVFFNLVKHKKGFSKFIQFGSGAEYDKSRNLIAVSEKDFGVSIPADQYGFFKYICSKYIENQPQMVVLRFFGVFGKYEDYETRFISNALTRIVMGLPILIRKNVFFDYIYVADVVRIVDYFITHEAKARAYNVGSGKRIDLLTIAKKIQKLTGDKRKIIVASDGLGFEYTCDNRRLLKEIREFHFTPLREAIVKLYDWYKSIKESLSLERIKSETLR